MSEQQTSRERRLANERALYRYTRAFERGDIDTIAAILQEASHNAELENMIYEMHHPPQQEDQLEKQSVKQDVPAPQKRLSQEAHTPGQLLPLFRAQRPHRQRALETLVAVLVVALLSIGSVLLVTSRLSGPGTGSHPRSTVAAQGMIIVLLGDGSIHAYHGGTGQSAWSYPTRQDGWAYSGLVVQGQIVYAALGANIYALHENNGTLIWHQTLPFQPHAGNPDDSQFLIDSGIVYASANGQPQSAVYALRASDGQVLWHVISDQPPLLAASNGVAYVAVTDLSPEQTQTTLEALRGSDEHELWHYTTNGTLLSAAVANNVAYVYAFPGAASADGNKDDKQLLALNANNGSQVWSHAVNYGNFSRLDYTQGVLLLSTGNQVCVHSTSNGAQLWCTPDFAGGLGMNNIVYLAGTDTVYIAYVIGINTPLSPTQIAGLCHQNQSCISSMQPGKNQPSTVQYTLHVYALDLQHGQARWHFDTPYQGNLLTLPLPKLAQIQKNTLLVSTTSPLVTALDTSNGRASWQINSSAPQSATLQMVATQ